MFIANFSFAAILLTVTAGSHEYPDIDAPVSIRESVERITALSDESALEPLAGTFGVPARRREGFFSATNIGMGVFLFGSTIADTESTYACLKYPQCVEGNPRQKDRVARGRGAVYPHGFAISGSMWLVSHWMRRSEHRAVRVIGWAFPIGLGSRESWAAIQNMKLRNKLRDRP